MVGPQGIRTWIPRLKVLSRICFHVTSDTILVLPVQCTDLDFLSTLCPVPLHALELVGNLVGNYCRDVPYIRGLETPCGPATGVLREPQAVL